MPSNAQQILADITEQRREEVAPHLSEQDYFEVFSVEEILKDYKLSYDEIENCIVDGEHDGGMDAVFTFIDGELLEEDFKASDFKKPSEIELHIIQSKTAGGFSEDPINRLISSTKHLLNLEAEYDRLDQYNSAVKEALDRFRSAYRKLASKFPKLKVNIHYAAKRADSKIHRNLKSKSHELIEQIISMFPEAEVNFDFLGAAELLEIARRQPNQTFSLKFARSLAGESGYVVLCKLVDFNRFLRDDGELIRTDLFESNVRDFQGSTEVNNEIAFALANDQSVDFWWLNNGVTLLGSRASLTSSIVTIENPQIVNGLQTSSQIAKYFDGLEPSADDTRMVMVKIVTSEDEEVRDKIIKATNSQNSVPLASLRATDKVQRDIEDGLSQVGLFYDRRKNYYKNQGKPAAKIVSIPLLAQALMTLLRGEPDNARARPSSLIKNDEDYRKLFSESHPLNAYTFAAQMIKRVEAALKARTELSARDRNNLRFYVLYWVAAIKAKTATLNVKSVSELTSASISDAEIEAAIDRVNKAFSKEGGSDQIAKGPDFKKKLVKKIRKKLAAVST